MNTFNASDFSSNWNYPTAIRFGAGRIKELAQCCEHLAITKPLLVTDPGLAALPIVKEAVDMCRSAGLDCGVFSGIKGNPTADNVMAGVAACQAGKHNGVIALGGGSALDAAKAIALMAGQTRPLWDFVDEGDNWARADAQAMLPVVAVPTTSGTGSEVGRASVITDSVNHTKKIIFHPNMLPEMVLADPALTIGLPAHITAATGMDALSHNLEAYCAIGYHPMAMGIATEGIRLIKESLITAYRNGDDLTARSNMMIASCMGATAFQKGLGAMHALAHTLGGLYDAHHGLLNAILMPYVLQANRSVIDELIVNLARCIDLEDKSFNGFMKWVLTLREQVGIPHTLSQININASEAAKIGEMATLDPAAGGNPIQFSALQYRELFTNAVEGKL